MTPGMAYRLSSRARSVINERAVNALILSVLLGEHATILQRGGTFVSERDGPR
jgi:hypothetical protein